MAEPTGVSECVCGWVGASTQFWDHYDTEHQGQDESWTDPSAVSRLACPKCGSHRVGCFRSPIKRKHLHRCAACGYKQHWGARP